MSAESSAVAVRVRVTGVVQGVGFRPFVYRLARERGLGGWVLNGEDGVVLVVEGMQRDISDFVEALRRDAPAASDIATLDVCSEPAAGLTEFCIVASGTSDAPTVRMSPDLAVCNDCLRELFDAADRRFHYPYINCTNCGPRYSIVLGLPYDRDRTVMRDWPMCQPCRREYDDPGDRRFHAQPVACHDCGPAFRFSSGAGPAAGADAIARAAQMLANGGIVAVKGIGGYHLACDADDPNAVAALRSRKYRKERPFALLVRNEATAFTLADFGEAARRALASPSRPIVLAQARRPFEGVAPENGDLGIMLAYTPVHHLLFAAGAPPVLVMTSANRSSEPIAYLDDDAVASLDGIADAFLAGERAIARRMDDSIVRVTGGITTVLRRGRGMAPLSVALLPKTGPILAVGGDLKNALTLVVDGQAFAGQHVGDLDHLSAREAFVAAARDLCATYQLAGEDVTVAHDLHPGYVSTQFALSFGARHIGVQHHRAHVASVLAERGAFDEPVLAFSFDGTGYGDDGTIWGGEVFAGSMATGLERVGHLRQSWLPGGDAAARFPVQAAAGFLYDVDDGEAFLEAPFAFPQRYSQARSLVAHGVRCFATTSMGRLFDTVAALCGFIREQTFEGQAAMWLEQLARDAGCDVPPYTIAFRDGELDVRPMLRAIVEDRVAGRSCEEVAAAFHAAIVRAIVALAAETADRRVVVSGGVFQNAVLIESLVSALGERLWFNTIVPPNDGGLSLGQAAFAAL